MLRIATHSLQDEKHVAVIGAKGFPNLDGAGGVEQGVKEVTLRLKEQGYEPIVYERGKNFTSSQKYGVKLQTIPFLNTQNLAGWTHAFLSFFHACFDRKPISVYHVHCAQNGIICLFARLTGKRVVFHLHGREWRATKWNWLMRRLIALNCLIGVIFSHSVLTVCRTSMNDLSRWLPSHRHKIHFVPNGVPEAPETVTNQGVAAIDKSRPFLLYSGRLVPQKNLSLLLKVFSDLQADMSLVIAGGTSHCSGYVSHIQQISAHDERILFTGRLDRQELWGLYQSCTALILPSAAEGCSNVLLEGLAAGCCIIASDIPENRLVLGDASLYFKANDEQSLKEVLSRTGQLSESLVDMRSAALHRGSQLPSWCDITDLIVRLYKT